MAFDFDLVDRWVLRVVFWVDAVRHYFVPVAGGHKNLRRLLHVQVIYLQHSAGDRHFGVVTGVVLDD